jgi:hypothetical protein
MSATSLALLLTSLALLLGLVHLTLLDECSHKLRVAFQNMKNLLLLVRCIGGFERLQKLLKSLFVQGRPWPCSSRHAASTSWWCADTDGRDRPTDVTAC